MCVKDEADMEIVLEIKVGCFFSARISDINNNVAMFLKDDNHDRSRGVFLP